MIPSILVRQLEKGLSDYIETTFPMTNVPFKGSLASMLNLAGESTGAVFREPYLSIKLPFRQQQNSQVVFESLSFKYPPYQHQVKAWLRLTGEKPLSTLVATGTGSGKTECFTYPIINYCWQHRGERGIKALIIYPMNALATDQAKRLAKLIAKSPKLKGNVTVGMYVGGNDGASHKDMGEDFVITDKETMLASPPDILLTNYKMLDYLLVRPKDAQLWTDNEPETLRFIAVDELHTFDGAQGTDLACLLRRLKSRLQVPEGHICCVGTSATMGTESSAEKICQYASQVFGTEFDTGAVITESRLSADDFFANTRQSEFQVPTAKELAEMDALASADDEGAYLQKAAKSFLSRPPIDVMSEAGRVELAASLMQHSLLQMMISRMAGKFWQATRLIYELQPTRSFPELSGVPQLERMVYALTALVSHARVRNEQGELRPFLTVNVQLWLRELRRLLGKVSADRVVYATASDLNDQKRRHYLPVANCRDCGATAWVSRLSPRNEAEIHELPVFYNRFFDGDAAILMIYPRLEGGVQKPFQAIEGLLCPSCMKVVFGDEPEADCPDCASKMIPVYLVHPAGQKYDQTYQYICPCCGSRRGLSLIGVRSATEISTMISQIMASRFNDDKKTLAFSDSVQDAAHRAGFFNSRTWRFALRGSIQQYVHDGGDGKSLYDFCEGFVKYFHKQLSEEEFVSRFIAPNMIWMRAYEDMKEKGHLGKDKAARKLLCDIEQRLKYEIMLEYGLTGQLGRTLEKSGSSMLSFHREDIERIAEAVQEFMINEQGEFTGATRRDFQQMVIGFLNRMRTNGAFDDPVFYQFVAEQGKSYHLTNARKHWLPGLQAGRNLPHHLVEKKPASGNARGRYDFLGSLKYTYWVDACYFELGESEQCPELVNKYILEESVKIGLIKVLAGSPEDSPVYGLSKERVFVTSQVRQMRCTDCGTVQPVPLDNMDYWQEAPCSRQQCEGHIIEDAQAGLNYYGMLYNQGSIVRVHAREHTGLLSRQDHETLEKDFKRREGEGRKPWDPNVLSCTPTLEMGIDIGDLSTVILCSMPPSQSKFLQRAGRAGRQDGNALALAVAGARPHDLYYYADPLEMVDGEVEPPRVFLNASAVLERQFVAYCMDTWVGQGISEGAIPRSVHTVIIKLESCPMDVFPFNFLHFVQRRMDQLLSDFFGMFGEAVTAVTKKALKKFAKGENVTDKTLHGQVLGAFRELGKQAEALRQNIGDIRTLRRKLEKGPQDSSFAKEISELKAEERALVNVLREMMRKDIFNFLSDEGILPNYAFPEAGIILKAILYRKEEPEEGDEKAQRKYEKLPSCEYPRPASAALSEFAPLNTFYAGGRKLTIDQVDVVKAEPERWRFCPNCNHAEKEQPGLGKACPHCQDAGWGDRGQVRTMLKVKMVYSNVDYKKSLIGDESDDRANTFYCKELFVDMEEKDITSAYRMDNNEFNFGYEFVKKASLREINFGESDSTDNQEGMLVAGRDKVRKGFKICRKCGKIQTTVMDKNGNVKQNKPKHAAYCPERNSKAALSSDVYEDCLFLYREFDTEILRLLIPATTMDSTTVRTESFVAAFMLGMKEYFGNVDHLRASVMEEPVPEADYRKQYLVIYDSVPGGTGYLKELMTEKNALVRIFEGALAVLEHCSCKDDPQRDGCYHCLYAYRQSRSLGSISRRAAIRLLKAILSGKDNVEQIKKLGDVPVNSLFDSELEQQFIAAFSAMSKLGCITQCVPDMVNGKEGYRLVVKGRTWEIEPQVNLGPLEGVKIPCKPDFVLRPIRQEDNPLPVAVFTDGFQHHRHIVADDTLKREAVRRSGRFIVWSLSWYDVQSVFTKSDKDYVTQVFCKENMPLKEKNYNLLMAKLGVQRPKEIDLIAPEKQTPFELLVCYLATPHAAELFCARAEEYAWRLLDTQKSRDKLAFLHWQEKMVKAESLTNFAEREFVFGKTIFGSWTPRKEKPCLKFMAGIQGMGHEPPVVLAWLMDTKEVSSTRIYEQEWNAFWHFWDVMQFLSHFVGVSETGILAEDYFRLPSQMREKMPEEKERQPEPWRDVMELFLTDEEKEAAITMSNAGIPVPEEIGSDVEGADGSVLASPVMAWTSHKIAFVTADMEEDIEALSVHGWQVFIKAEDLKPAMFV